MRRFRWMDDSDIVAAVRALFKGWLCRYLGHRWLTDDYYDEVVACRRCRALEWKPGRGPNDPRPSYCGNRWATQSPMSVRLKGRYPA